MTSATRSAGLREQFREIQPGVTASFGGNHHLFQRWWHDLSLVDPIDADYIATYSTNDRFLRNRLLLPEEVPFLALPIVRTAIQRGYGRVFFLERGTHPFLWAAQQIMDRLGARRPRLGPVRVKGLTRETLACNLLTLASRPADTRSLAQELSADERGRLRALLAGRTGRSVQRRLAEDGRTARELLSGSRQELILALAGQGIDSRIGIPNILKSVVFDVGNRLLDGPVSAADLLATTQPPLIALSPPARAAIHAMVRACADARGALSFRALVDWLNRYVRAMRGTLRHDGQPFLNAVLSGTRTASSLFPDGRVLFIDEISVCGSACLALELIGQAFNPRCCVDFGAVVGMPTSGTFADLMCASFETFKPLEDVPYLSPSYYVPRTGQQALRPVRPQYCPSVAAVADVVLRWDSATFTETTRLLGPDSPAAACLAALREREIVDAVAGRVHWAAYPVIRRRSAHNPEVLAALVYYFLATFEQAGQQVILHRESLAEARLETVLGASGALHKPFAREMDQFFGELLAWQRDQPAEVTALRARLAPCQQSLRRRTVQGAIADHGAYLIRMEGGLQAVWRRWDEVAEYLAAAEESPQAAWQRFADLFQRLQAATR